jgi:guanylate kinase|tara:strand:- start:4351 stop:5019 length:669 start_codon:yes stop_codon:yes gene_type:complete
MTELDNINDVFTQNKFRGMVLVLDGLLGGGKTTLARLLTQTEKHINFSISATTRPKREGEIDGLNYHFMTKEEFLQKKEEGYFLETTERLGNYYGTPKQQVEDALANGEDIIFDIDYVGTRELKKQMGEDVISVFLVPPSYEVLKQRLWDRGSETEESFKVRMKQNAEYLKLWEEYDYIFINDTLQDTLRRLQQILRAERLKRHRQPWLEPFVTNFTAEFED